MAQELSDETFRALGLEPEQLSDPDEIELAGGVDRAFQAESLATKQTAMGAEEFVEHLRSRNWSAERRSPNLERAGVEAATAQEDPHLATFRAVNGDEIQVETVGAAKSGASGPRGAYVDPASASRIYVDFRVSGPVSLTVDGERLVVDQNSGVMKVWGVHGLADATAEDDGAEPSEGPEAPVREWLDEAEDAWLCEHLDRYLESDDAWRHAAAVGIWGRLREQSSESWQNAFDALMEGEAEPGAERANQWADSLDEEQLTELRELTVERVDLLEASMERLQRSPNPDEPGWMARYRRVLHGRDDLDAAMWALADSGAMEGLGALVDSLDEKGRRLVASLPSVDELQGDERLVRAAKLHPEAWWVFPAIDQKEEVRGNPSYGVLSEKERRRLGGQSD